MIEVSLEDRAELKKFIAYLEKVREGMPHFQAYGEIYGEVVFEDSETGGTEP